MGWQPIETAPKGGFRTVKVGDKGGERKISVPQSVLAMTSSGNMTLTHWLEDAGRWVMFSANHPPKYWWDFGDGNPQPEPPPQ
jgi:hypothetical protein